MESEVGMTDDTENHKQTELTIMKEEKEIYLALSNIVIERGNNQKDRVLEISQGRNGGIISKFIDVPICYPQCGSINIETNNDIKHLKHLKHKVPVFMQRLLINFNNENINWRKVFKEISSVSSNVKGCIHVKGMTLSSKMLSSILGMFSHTKILNIDSNLKLIKPLNKITKLSFKFETINLVGQQIDEESLKIFLDWMLKGDSLKETLLDLLIDERNRSYIDKIREMLYENNFNTKVKAF